MYLKYFFITGLLATTLAVGVATAWSGQIVTLAEDMVLPAAPVNDCSIVEFDPFPMKTFSQVTFMGKGTDIFRLRYMFSIEPVKFVVAAPSGKSYGGQCIIENGRSEERRVGKECRL